jgi:2-dehydro-3-deoxyphosphogluconate aldolase/(4S)-4-hydroxy-2-oxoglutarate aldolase
MITDRQNNAAESIAQSGVVIIIRMDNLGQIRAIANALHKGGVRCFEIPMTAGNADEIIRDLTSQLPGDAVIGAGTVLTAEDANRIINAGARFIVSPHFVPEIAVVCKERRIANIPGAFSPLEVYTAWKSGAEIVKVFSIQPLGPAYLSDLAGPYPGIRLMPTGGITLGNAERFIKAGACAVTIGRDLIGKGPWDAAALEAITARARALTEKIRQVKLELQTE